MAYEVFKTIDPSNISKLPFTTHKEFVITDATSGSYGLHASTGTYLTGSFASTDPINPDGTYQRGIWHFIDQMYYKFGVGIINPYSAVHSQIRTLKLHERTSVISIPMELCGEKMQPKKITLIDDSGATTLTIKDDGYGNLYDASIDTSNFATGSALIAHYSFDNGYIRKNRTDSRIILDDSQVGHYGWGQSVIYKDGVFGTGITFTGVSSSYGRIESYEDINFKKDDEFTISFHVALPISQSDTSQTYNTIFGKEGRWARYEEHLLQPGDSPDVIPEKISNVQSSDHQAPKFGLNVDEDSAPYPYIFGVYNHTATDPGRLFFRRGIGSSGSADYVELITTASIADGTYKHVTVRKKDNELKLYVDRTLHISVSETTVATDNKSDLWLGRDGLGNTPCSCSLDELRFYDIGLSESEIYSLHDTPSNTNMVGNVFYTHGIMTITHPDSTYDDVGQGIGANGFTLTHRATQEHVENEIICIINKGEFNMSTNPTIRKTGRLDDTELLGIATHSSFNSYFTTLGCYNDEGDLLVIGKTSRPIKNDKNLALAVAIRWDS